jgi:Zn-dependent protease with chaperone function
MVFWVENLDTKNRSLNPFAFPPDTNALFALLVVSAVLWTLELGQIITQTIGNFLVPSRQAMSQDFLYSIINFLLPILLIVFVFVLAFLIYLTHPWRIRRRTSSHPLTRNNDLRFWDSISEFSTACNISPLPAIEIGSQAHSTNAQVFGFGKSYIIRLDRGLRLLFRQDKERFRAIILHELAHIANGDIARTYFTQAIWTAIILLAVTPTLILIIRFFLLAISNYHTLQALVVSVLVLLIKVVCMLLIIASIRRNVLRSRELFADQKAGIWGAREGLINILQGNTIVENQKKQRMFWGFHPSSKERLETLQSSTRLFQIQPTLPFFVGILIGLTTGGVFYANKLSEIIIELVGITLQNTLNITLPEWSVYLILLILVSPLILIMTLLVSNSLGIAVQRETITHIANGNFGLSSYFSLGKSAILLAIGFEAGSFLTISSPLEELPGLLNTTSDFLAFSIILLGTVFLFVTANWLVLSYLRFFSRRFIGTHISRSIPSAKISILSFISSLILMLFYSPIFFILSVIDIFSSDIGTFSGLVVFLIIAFIAIFLLYAAIFIGTFIFLWIYNSRRQPRCPICGSAAQKGSSVGQICHHCGNELALWVYVNT